MPHLQWKLSGSSDCLHCPMRQLSIFAGLSAEDLSNLGMEVLRYPESCGHFRLSIMDRGGFYGKESAELYG